MNINKIGKLTTIKLKNNFYIEQKYLKYKKEVDYFNSLPCIECKASSLPLSYFFEEDIKNKNFKIENQKQLCKIGKLITNFFKTKTLRQAGVDGQRGFWVGYYELSKPERIKHFGKEL